MSQQTIEKLENYLIQMDANYQTLAEGLWLVEDGGVKVAISLEEGIVFFRVNLFPIPEKKREALFEKLLQLNTTSMLLGAYGIEGDKIVIVDSLTTDSIDYNEFQASIESVSLAAIDHYQELKALIKKD